MDTFAKTHFEQSYAPTLLIIFDGWGYRADSTDNAITKAKTPHWDDLWQHSPHALIEGSGKAVGLPCGQMGNSEVGHLNMGAGRVVHQDFTRIGLAIEDKTFFENPTLCSAVDVAIETDCALHVLGLLSPGGVHSHEAQILALFELAAQRGLKKIYLHAFLDGRDTPPRSALASIQMFEQKFAELGTGRFASLVGRYYAMDRDKRWERTQVAYDLITGTASYSAHSAEEALGSAYARGESDEFVKPTAIDKQGEGRVALEKGDVVIFMNYRADRARQLTLALTSPDFSGFVRPSWPRPARFVTLTEYSADFNLPVAFAPEILSNTLGEYLSKHKLPQLRIAETEKYAHVTFFFNGGIEKPYPLEDRVLIPSPHVATYDLQPAMSAPELTDRLILALQSRHYAFIVCNYANADMVGHTGNFEATVKAIEALDDCLGRILAVLHQVEGQVLITADHGNAEFMYDPATGQAHTAHTTAKVPFVYKGRAAHITKPEGVLADLAPTILTVMELPIPDEMTGTSLLTLEG